jgi:ubiquitin-like modifier-activating enzyme ATG7
MDTLKLSSEALEVRGSYGAGRSVVDRETGREVGLGCGIGVEGGAFVGGEEGEGSSMESVHCRRYFKNLNMIVEFKIADKAAIFNQIASEVHYSITLSVLSL